MALTVSAEKTNEAFIITLAGSLDASSAPSLISEVEKAVADSAKRLVLLVKDLEYIASAGLRVILFAKQKLGSDADIYVIAPQEAVLHTLELSGFSQAVIVADTYEG